MNVLIQECESLTFQQEPRAARSMERHLSHAECRDDRHNTADDTEDAEHPGQRCRTEDRVCQQDDAEDDAQRTQDADAQSGATEGADDVDAAND